MTADSGGRSGLDGSVGLPDRLNDRDGLLASAVLGALVAVVLSVLPFSPVLGGAASVARYGNDRYAVGAGVGLLAGLGAAMPLAVLLGAALWIVGALGVGVLPSSPAYDVFLAVVGALFLFYTVGLSALGGLVGVWVDRHTVWTLDPVAWV